jgi:hypothetical protein
MTRMVNSPTPTPYPEGTEWTWMSRPTGVEMQRRGELDLMWAIEDGGMVDDVVGATTIGAVDLFALWLGRLADARLWDPRGPGWLGLSWSVGAGDDICTAPFGPVNRPNFLSSNTWPRSPVTGAQVDWWRLPVVRQHWHPDACPAEDDAAGFVVDATGWMPTALQPAVYVPALAGAAGLLAP